MPIAKLKGSSKNQLTGREYRPPIKAPMAPLRNTSPVNWRPTIEEGKARVCFIQLVAAMSVDLSAGGRCLALRKRGANAPNPISMRMIETGAGRRKSGWLGTAKMLPMAVAVNVATCLRIPLS